MLYPGEPKIVLCVSVNSHSSVFYEIGMGGVSSCVSHSQAAGLGRPEDWVALEKRGPGVPARSRWV